MDRGAGGRLVDAEIPPLPLHLRPLLYLNKGLPSENALIFEVIMNCFN